MKMPATESERAVFAALLREKTDDQAPLAVVDQFTDASFRRHLSDQPISSEILWWRLKLRGLSAETTEAFVKANEAPACLEGEIAPDLATRILTTGEAEELWDSGPDSKRGGPRDGWNEFRQRFPGAKRVFRFSRVGFDRDQRQALVEFVVQAHWLMRSAELVLLSAETGNWTRRGTLLLSLS